MADQSAKTSDKTSKPKAPNKGAKGKGDDTGAPDDASTPKFDPKPVNVGGESLVDRLYPHRKKIGMFVLSAAVIWGVIAIVIHFKNKHEEDATAKLVAVLDLGQQSVRPEGPPDTGSAGSGSTDAKQPEFASPTERANQLLGALAKQGTDAAGPLYRASLLVQIGKYDDAIAEYQRAQELTGLDGVLAREGLGLAQEQRALALKNDAAGRQKGLEDALATFKSEQPDEKGPRRSYALYHQGRILALLGKNAEAKAAFDKAKELAKDSPDLAELVEQRLASLGT